MTQQAPKRRRPLEILRELEALTFGPCDCAMPPPHDDSECEHVRYRTLLSELGTSLRASRSQQKGRRP